MSNQRQDEGSYGFKLNPTGFHKFSYREKGRQLHTTSLLNNGKYYKNNT